MYLAAAEGELRGRRRIGDDEIERVVAIAPCALVTRRATVCLPGPSAVSVNETFAPVDRGTKVTPL